MARGEGVHGRHSDPSSRGVRRGPRVRLEQGRPGALVGGGWRRCAVLTAGAVGNAVVVYHEYCMGLPEDPFRDYFQRVGANEFGAWQYDRPRVVVRARGRTTWPREPCPSISRPSAPPSMPPRSRRSRRGRGLRGSACRSRREPGQPTLRRTAPSFIEKTTGSGSCSPSKDAFAGSLGLAAWLQSSGYSEVHAEIEPVLQPLDVPQGRPPTTPPHSASSPSHAPSASDGGHVGGGAAGAGPGARPAPRSSWTRSWRSPPSTGPPWE